MRIRELWIVDGKTSRRTEELLRLAREKQIPVVRKKRETLSFLVPDTAHQGVVALSDGFRYADLASVIRASQEAPGRGLLVAADHITDEGNLGALIRTAAFFGAHGLILPKDRSAGVSPGVLKRAAGAVARLSVVKAVNLGRVLDFLEKKGFWIVGASGDGPASVYRFDWRRDLVLVLGNEQRGMGRLIRRRCHEVVRVPSPGGVESLNVAVAGGVILSEIFRQREAGHGARGHKGPDEGA